MRVLKLIDVSYKYEGTKKTILKNINLSFNSGKVYTIVGKSGSGKSTLLSLISGLDVCVNGEILFGATSLKKMDRDDYRAKSIGVIFQSFNLLTNATAVENIVLSMNISGRKEKDKKAFAYALLEKVGIYRDTADRKILKLSGGEQQRVGIARALSHNPDIIIADEPTGNLDRDTEADVLKIFTSLARDEGKCVIIVTHSKKVTSIADEIWGLNAGNLFLINNEGQEERQREIIE
ncbi:MULTISPECIES: ABC transporter ATP-binding protein [unclassified Sutcliffiella]|uniref:ABC transporter ATP-binding protein n=1 Tax=unclassified Sutcliffiella TaxID=2837532 RepID=UPI0030CA866C